MHPVLRNVIVAVFLFATPLFARVISYAPYTNRVAIPAFQERTTRYFALIESRDRNTWSYGNEVVLYDSRGLEEPRVIVAPAADTNIRGVALYEPAGGGAPWLLVTLQRGSAHRTQFSRDGGATWREVEGLAGMNLRVESNVDHGGPFTHGLGAPIRLGSAEWPFVVSGQGVWAVNAQGVAKALVPASGSLAIGQNRQGTKFLVSNADVAAPATTTSIDIVGLDGGATRVASGLHRSGTYYGWIASDESVYLLVQRWEGRFLYRIRGASPEFIAGPHDIPPPPLGSGYNGVNRDTANFFAVPTIDFENAWIIQRGAGKPTTLSRHIRSSGELQTMWNDITGPQVEALIAGASGETLLVQVHRERDNAISQIFLDPALAVWRVGEPAPRHYDELFLNEGPTKGFVHVDVDRVAEGEPFVFDSGALQPNGGVIIISPPPAGGGDVIQEWGVVRASLKQHLVLPGVARLPGAFDSYWLTDVFIANPSTQPQKVEVRFVPLGEVNAQVGARVVNLTLGASEIRLIRDVLHSLFSIDTGGGTLHFIPDSGINVTSRTFSRKGEGTFGFGMQAIDFFNAASPRFPVSFAGAFPGANFRTNLILTDTSGRGTEATISAHGVTGTIGFGSPSVAAHPDGVMQFNAVDSSLGLHPWEAGGLVLKPSRGGGIATVVAIDNRTNDPTYFPPDLPGSVTRMIPVIGHVDGAHGSRFRSDLYLINPSADAQTVTLEATLWDTSSSKNIQFTLLPGEARVVPDALRSLFGMTGLARLRYTGFQNEGVRVTSRTYTIDESGATYGSLIPPLNNFQFAAAGERLEILGVGGGGAFRTNLGLVNGSGWGSGTVRVAVSLVGSNRNNILDRFTVEVPVRGGMQLNDIFTARGVAEPEAGMILVEVLSSGVIGAYATVTDNITNDTIYLNANLGAQ